MRNILLLLVLGLLISGDSFTTQARAEASHQLRIATLAPRDSPLGDVYQQLKTGMKERTGLLHGFSKAFAMTGFRLGYACAPAPLREAMMKIHQYCMLCAPIMSQMAGIEALKMGESAYEDTRQSYEQRRNLIVSRLNGMGLHCFNPGGAFYVFPDIRSTGLSSKEFAMKLLEQENVACVPGGAFGTSGEGFLRCCYATAFEDIRTATDRMQRFVARL